MSILEASVIVVLVTVAGLVGALLMAAALKGPKA